MNSWLILLYGTEIGDVFNSMVLFHFICIPDVVIRNWFQVMVSLIQQWLGKLWSVEILLPDTVRFTCLVKAFKRDSGWQEI